jgi:aspartate aminotransferase
MAAAAAPSRHRNPLDLTVGEPEGPPPLEVREAAAAAAMEGRARYGPAQGLPQLRALVAADLARREGLARSPESVLLTAGGKAAILDALRCLLDPGDEVLVFAPYWPSFPDQVRWAGGTPVIVEPDETLLPSAEAIERALSPRTRAVILNQPSNPTGRSWERARVEHLAGLVLRHRLWLIVDQVYATLIYDGPEEPLLRQVPELAAQCVVVESFSKRFAMTGYRLGTAVGPQPLIDAMTRLASSSVTHPCMLSQHAAVTALSLDGTWERAQQVELRARRDLLAAGLGALEGVRVAAPEGALYLFPDVTRWLASLGLAGDAELVARLRDEAGLKVLPGSAFGAPGHLRLSFAASRATLEAGLERLRAF